LPYRLLLSGKLALKRSSLQSKLPDVGFSRTGLTSILSIARLGYRFYGKWDASTELRHLALVADEGNEMKAGTLLELGYTVGRFLRLGAGYNFSHFSDDELRELERDSHGFFIRMTGHY
jgi:hypothetical protein